MKRKHNGLQVSIKEYCSKTKIIFVFSDLCVHGVVSIYGQLARPQKKCKFFLVFKVLQLYRIFQCDNSTYIWTDGTPVDYLWWQPGYPGSGDPEKSCVTIWVTSLLKLNPGYVQGQFDDIWDCGTNLATPTCRYDPTSSRNLWNHTIKT